MLSNPRESVCDKASDLEDVFRVFLFSEQLSAHMNAIVGLISRSEFSTVSLKSVLNEYKIRGIESIKQEVLDLLLIYVNLLLKNSSFTNKEYRNMALLKRFLKVKEGDFFKYRYQEIKNIIIEQLQNISKDDSIDSVEVRPKVNLKSLFDLSHDQYLQITEREIHNAFKLRINIPELGTSDVLKG